MSKLIIDDEDLSNKVKDLSFSCGICGSRNTYIDFNRGVTYEGGGDIGSILLGCRDCEACFSPIYDDEWVKQK
jgi:alpha-D-ribose 1-methylphosphonate 5-phosphate C-P lyase